MNGWGDGAELEPEVILTVPPLLKIHTLHLWESGSTSYVRVISKTSGRGTGRMGVSVGVVGVDGEWCASRGMEMVAVNHQREDLESRVERGLSTGNSRAAVVIHRHDKKKLG